MKKNERISDGQGFVAASEAEIEAGEDSYAAGTDASGGFLCVADGCGGSGARRYANLNGRTEAYFAARTAVACASGFAASFRGKALPADTAAARPFAERLQAELTADLSAFHADHRIDAPSAILRNSMRRTLPAAFCLSLIDARAEDRLSAVFFWAGDCRGYALCPDGLRQCTADHVAGRPDAMENLYRDARLTNLVSADGRFHIDTCGLTLPKPCVLLTATDGAFGYLPTPMEFELLLLQTLRHAVGLRSWQRRLTGALGRTAGDDATVALTCYGFSFFSDLQAAYAPRRAAMQARYVTPVRRRHQDPAFARTLWDRYRPEYQLCKEAEHADWRL